MKSDCEEWRITTLNDGYEVSNLGNVRSLDRVIKSSFRDKPYTRQVKGQSLRRRTNGAGYQHVSIAGKDVTVHRLVVLAFIGPVPVGFEINHKNGIRADNRLGNLEIVTPSQNVRHSLEIGLVPSRKGSANSRAKLTESDAMKILTSKTKTVSELAAEFGISRGQVWGIRTGRNWKHLQAAK